LGILGCRQPRQHLWVVEGASKRTNWQVRPHAAAVQPCNCNAGSTSQLLLVRACRAGMGGRNQATDKEPVGHMCWAQPASTMCKCALVLAVKKGHHVYSTWKRHCKGPASMQRVRAALACIIFVLLVGKVWSHVSRLEGGWHSVPACTATLGTSACGTSAATLPPTGRRLNLHALGSPHTRCHIPSCPV
jgi:hypothetical protein